MTAAGGPTVASLAQSLLTISCAIRAMVEIGGSATSRPGTTRRAGIAAAAVAGLALPRVRVPLALGRAGYLAIILSKPNQVVRGRTPFPRRTIGGLRSSSAAPFSGLAALTSTALAGLDLACRLELQFVDRIEIAGAGVLRMGEN